MLLRILGVVPIAAGLATVESELRFHGAWWVGAGVFLLRIRTA